MMEAVTLYSGCRRVSTRTRTTLSAIGISNPCPHPLSHAHLRPTFGPDQESCASALPGARSMLRAMLRSRRTGTAPQHITSRWLPPTTFHALCSAHAPFDVRGSSVSAVGSVLLSALCVDACGGFARLKRRNKLVYDQAAAHTTRLVVTMGGGYPRNPEQLPVDGWVRSTPFLSVVQCHMDVYRAAAVANARWTK